DGPCAFPVGTLVEFDNVPPTGRPWADNAVNIRAAAGAPLRAPASIRPAQPGRATGSAHGSAQARFEEAIAARMANGLPRSAAAAAVVREQPTLQAAAIAEATAQAAERTAARRRR